MGARVVHEDDVPARALRGGPGSVHTLIDRHSGSRRVLQRVIRVSIGEALPPTVPWAEDVLYVARGAVSLTVDPHRQDIALRPGHAVLIPPTWPYRVSSPSGEAVMVSVASPPPEPGRMYTLPIVIGERSAAVVHEEDEPALPAGEDRHFKLLVDPRHGARNVTQFVGFIERSRAPLHTHTYEEAIYILSGEGILHVAGDQAFDAPIRPGTSIFLPPGTPHCLENAGRGLLKLLGVFSPPGSPAAGKEG